MKSNVRKIEERARPGSGAAMDKPIERRFPKWAKPVTIGLGVLLLSALAYIFLMPEEGRTLRLAGNRVTVSQVTTGTFEDFIPVRGRVTPLRTVFLDAVEGGRVEEVLVEDGAMVEQGRLLLRLANTQLQLDVIAREAQVTEQLNNLNTLELQLEQNRLSHARNLVEIDYQITRLGRLVERREKLLASEHVSRQDYDEAADELAYWKARREVTLEAQETDARLQQAQMAQLRESVGQLRRNLQLARKSLENLNLRAPVAGQLTAFDVEIGQSISRGERIGQIDSPEEFKLTALIDEFYLPRVDIAQTATAEIEGRDYALHVSKVYPQVRDGQFQVDLTFENAMPEGIRRGQTVQTRLTLGDPSQALLIPNGAFYQDTGGNWVFVVAPDGSVAVKRTVRLGRRNARFIEVLEGLEPGEQVITSPYTGFTEMDRLELEG